MLIFTSEQIWNDLEIHSYLNAAQVYLIASAIYKSLESLRNEPGRYLNVFSAD